MARERIEAFIEELLEFPRTDNIQYLLCHLEQQLSDLDDDSFASDCYFY